MKVYGADFSGAIVPRGLYFARGELGTESLAIEEVERCEERLELFMAITKSRAPWGLDFPFSLPSRALEKLGLASWEQLLKLTASSTREEFKELLSRKLFKGYEARCSTHSTGCRYGDAEVKAFSPLKCFNPDMRTMTFAGLRMLSHLQDFGAKIYPFDCYTASNPRLYEVYPSHTWRGMELKWNNSLEPFVNEFNSRSSIEVKLSQKTLKENVKSKDAADAVVACATLAECIARYGIDGVWDKKWGGLSEGEWQARYKEGLIVRL